MKYSSMYRLALRLTVSPFLLAILLVTFTFAAVKRWVAFVRYGGEWQVYDKETAITIQDLYESLKSEAK